jgi:hypothetical protein
MRDAQNHIDEKTIELYLLASPLVKEQRATIKRHLSDCPWCASLYQEMQTYYREVEKLQREQAQRSSTALYPVERMVRLRARENRDSVVSSPPTIPQRVAESLRRYPLRWAIAVAAFAAAVVLMVPRSMRGDPNPVFAKPEKEFIVVWNRHGEELWRKHIGLGIDRQALPSYVATQPSQGFPVADIDGDGRNEVFAVFGWANWNVQGNPLLRAVVGFNADGSERWRYELHRNISIGDVPFSDDYRFYQLVVGDFDHDGKYEVIGLASHIPWFPNVIVKLDAQNGSLLGEYWHNGMLPWLDQKDIDGDGVDELFLGGQNNRLQQASLAVLDPRQIRGQAPAPSEFTVKGILPGYERYYVLFPVSDLKPVWADITNEVTGVAWKSDSTLEVVVSEKVRSPHQDIQSSRPYEGGTLYFYFDRSMRCIRVLASDAFSATHALYEQIGVVKGRIDPAYLERLRQGVQYWDGGKFVKDPMVNRRSREVVMR